MTPIRSNTGRRTGMAGLLVTGILLLLVRGGGCEVPAHAILRDADRARGNLAGIRWTVRVTSTEDGRVQHRTLDVKARGYDYLAVLQAPPKVRGQKLLMVNRNMWYTKPGLRKPVPISPRQRLLGGAAYGDVAATNYADDYEVLDVAAEPVDGEPCHRFDLRAKTPKATYDRIRYWVSRARRVGLRAEYYTVSGRLLKTARFAYDHTLTVDGREQPFISRMRITDAIQSGDVTVLAFDRGRPMPLGPETFNLNLLTLP